ncbi:ATP synthase F1 subunit delta [Adhaeribacter aquaticus]|uniref:ATP synthase F1 subunit delta n=1 Tax=Adhaeribacter aquaticus TaxID=299567 RepID=UPI0003FA8A17|nr:ATP synthase F1 subunit delta [Adhaeribacter aquaticus]
MSDIRVASRYAKSLIDLAQERGILEQVHQDMQLFNKTATSNRDFKLFLTNPIINNSKKLAVLKKIFAGKVSELTQKFFEIIAQKNRESHLDAVATEFIRQYNVIKGIEKAIVTTAVPLTPELRTQLSQKVAQLTGKTIQLEEKVDPSLIGGFVLRVGDKQVDDSIKTNLRNLKKKFKENPYINKL